MTKQRIKRSVLKKNLRAVVFAVSIVLFWRGAWGLMDLYLFPDDPATSFMVSIVAGLALLFIINHHKLDLE